MLSKALLWFGMLVVAIVGFYAYKHYRHSWGYDDDTQIHSVPTDPSSSLPTSRLDQPALGHPAVIVLYNPA
jgi:hypothetical protein